jgi:hypothetical protein
MWIEDYKKCGCSSEAKEKKDLLGYCKTHGHSFARRYRINEYYRVKINSCSNSRDPWYMDKIGKVILVKNIDSSTHVEAKNGRMVFMGDLEKQ